MTAETPAAISAVAAEAADETSVEMDATTIVTSRRHNDHDEGEDDESDTGAGHQSGRNAAATNAGDAAAAAGSGVDDLSSPDEIDVSSVNGTAYVESITPVMIAWRMMETSTTGEADDTVAPTRVSSLHSSVVDAESTPYTSWHMGQCTTTEEFNQTIQAMRSQCKGIESLFVSREITNYGGLIMIRLNQQNRMASQRNLHPNNCQCCYRTIQNVERFLKATLYPTSTSLSSTLDSIHFSWFDDSPTLQQQEKIEPILCHYFHFARSCMFVSCVTIELWNIPTKLCTILSTLPYLEQVTLGSIRQHDDISAILQSKSLKRLEIKDSMSQRQTAWAVQQILHALTREPTSEPADRVQSSSSNSTPEETTTSATDDCTTDNVPPMESSATIPVTNLSSLKIPFHKELINDIVSLIGSDQYPKSLTRIEFRGHADWAPNMGIGGDTFFIDLADAVSRNTTLKSLLLPYFLGGGFGRLHEDDDGNDTKQMIIDCLKYHNMTLEYLYWPGWNNTVTSSIRSSAARGSSAATGGDDNTTPLTNNEATTSETVDDETVFLLQYYLDLNKMGRKRIFSINGPPSSSSSSSTSDNNGDSTTCARSNGMTYVEWIELLVNSNGNINCLYYVLRKNPALCRLDS